MNRKTKLQIQIRWPKLNKDFVIFRTEPILGFENFG